MSAASQALRIAGDAVQVVAFERGSAPDRSRQEPVTHRSGKHQA